MTYKEKQKNHQAGLIKVPNIFDGCQTYKRNDKEPEYLLKESIYNLYRPIRDQVINYFKDNSISWWGGKGPTDNTLSSQIACLNHLMPIMDDKDAVLAMINGIKNEFTDVIPLKCDKDPQYIAFEVVCTGNYLNENRLTRGSNCTSVDAMILAKHKYGKDVLIPIEWKYTENNTGKESSDTRHSRYDSLINNSEQLIGLDEITDTKNKLKAEEIYFYDPFYELMRQTLLAEQVVSHKKLLIADDFLHINVIPKNNKSFVGKKYKISGDTLEATWRSCLKDQSKYQIIDPSDLFEPLKGNEKYKDLIAYLEKRYWNDSI